jgi:hypothetical protein
MILDRKQKIGMLWRVLMVLLAVATAANVLPRKAMADLVAVPDVRRDRFTHEGKKIRFGNFNILPTLLIKNTVDDNALYSDKGPQTDDILDIQPGINILGHGTKMDLMLGYNLGVHENIRFNVQDFISHKFSGEFYSKPLGRRIFMRLADYLVKTSEPADIEILDKMNILDNEAAGEIGYVAPGEDLQVSFGYVNNYKTYTDIWNGSNFYGNGFEFKSRFNLSSRYRFLPKTQATFDFNYTRAKQTFGQDVYGGDVLSNGYRIVVGITGTFTRKLSLMANAGYSKIDFNIDSDSSDFVTELGLTYSLTKRFIARAGFARAVSYSIYSPYSKTYNYNVGLNYAFYRKLKVDLKLDLSDISFSGPVDNGAGLRRGDFDTRLEVTITYGFSNWISVIAGYKLQNRASNMIGPVQGTGSADFLRNTYLVGVGFNYF